MTRYRPMSEEQLYGRLKDLRKELFNAETQMDVAREENNLKQYKAARLIRDEAVADIEEVMATLHPMVPPDWYDKYGQPIIPAPADDESEG